MTSISENLDLNQGFHFQSSRTSAVGHLQSPRLGPDSRHLGDQPHQRHDRNSRGRPKPRLVGRWVGDAINLYAYISTANRQLVLTLLQQPMSSISVVFDLATYSFDPIERRSCEHFGSPTPPLRGSIQKQGANFSIHLDSEPAAWRALGTGACT
jgi:hypothetical protein